jgi:hypothetical protein
LAVDNTLAIENKTSQSLSRGNDDTTAREWEMMGRRGGGGRERDRERERETERG